MSTAQPVADAYRHCERITRARAGNFYYGIRLLPAPKRRAMCAVYAFARRIDDIGDGGLGAARKLQVLEREAQLLAGMTRRDTGALGDVSAHDSGAATGDDSETEAVMVALADANARFALPLDALADLIEGVRMDVAGTSYERFDELLVYCRRVAGAIGRLCLAVFDVRLRDHSQAAHASALADDLGVALQLTNILRDLREDAGLGRLYLPAEDLRRFGILAADERPHAGALFAAAAGAEKANAKLAELVRFEAERAQEWFERGIELVAMLDRRSAACVLAMAGIYRRLLERIATDPLAAVAQRMSLDPWEKAWVAMASLVAQKRPPRRRPESAREPVGGRR